jgi:hypothetical protein
MDYRKVLFSDISSRDDIALQAVIQKNPQPFSVNIA